MAGRLTIIGAPSSAGAYAPGQEQAPQALRRAGLVPLLRERGVDVDDRGDTPQVRWRTDRASPRAMNVEQVVGTVTAVADRVREAHPTSDSPVLVLGGDCTVGVGTVAGAVAAAASGSSPLSVGLVYVDQDADLKTPSTTDEGALDWMGVAHMLALDGALEQLAGVAGRTPMLHASQLFLLGQVDPTDSEREVIRARDVAWAPADEVRADPVAAADRAIAWGRQFDALLVHVDIDVVDFADAPLAENTRRNRGLELGELWSVLERLTAAPNWCGLTICEVNPDHGEPDGSTMVDFASALADVLGGGLRD